MPLNYLDLQPQLERYSGDAAQYQQQKEEQLEKALSLLQNSFTNLEKMREIGTQARSRIALPTLEDPGKYIIPQHTEPTHANIVSADGSQISPDAHSFPIIALVNIGIIRITAGMDAPLEPTTISKLYSIDELYHTDDNSRSLLTEDEINLDRDVLEMKYLIQYSSFPSSPTIALRDGLMELYHQPQPGTRFTERLAEYNNYLATLQRAKVLAAGYIDKPRARSLTQLLELILQMEQGNNLTDCAFPNINDRDIFSSLLPPGSRSALFELYSPVAGSVSQTELLQFYCFYLNVSATMKPWIVRIEVPQWVTENPQHIELLHNILLEQCAIMGAKPYPYCLHRAHETAIVHHTEKRDIENHLRTKYMQADISIDEKSYKQAAKDLEPRKKVKR